MSDSFKGVIRVPTAEQYAYLEIDVEGSPESILASYERFNVLVKSGIGLEQKEWNYVVDKYRSGKGMSADEHERMNKAQQWMIHELDKSDARLKIKTK